MVMVQRPRQVGLKQRIPIGHIALEAVFVVFAAAVALLANSWREDRAAEERATVALAAIEDEVRANSVALRAAVQYHGDLLGRLHAHAGSVAGDAGTIEAPAMSVFSRGFVAPANLSRHAWRSAASTGALEAAPYARVLELESAYQEQLRYEQQVDIVSGEIYRLLFDGGTDRVRRSWQSLTAVLSTLVFRECALIESLESRLGGPSNPDERQPGACAKFPRGADPAPPTR